jgi:hypothetical protein
VGAGGGGGGPPRPPPPARPRPAGCGPPPERARGRVGLRPPGPPADEVTGALPQVFTIIGSVVAPTTLLTALLLYFGRLHAQGLFRYLRVPSTVLDLTPEDYLVRSADGLFVPLTVAAALVAVTCWGHRLLVGVTSDSRRAGVTRVLAPTAAVVGTASVCFAVIAMIVRDTAFPDFPEVGGLSLAIGVLLLAYAVRLIRILAIARRPGLRSRTSSGVVAEWTAIFLLVGVGVFWAVNGYAIGVGTGRGQQIASELGDAPDVVLYSEKSLSLDLPGVREVPCDDAEAAYGFRYEGLKFVLQSGDQYLFLPAGGATRTVPRSWCRVVTPYVWSSVPPAPSLPRPRVERRRSARGGECGDQCGVRPAG